MNVITGYIVREILKGSVIALLFLLTMFNLFTFADELGDLGKGSYGLPQILYYLALTSPTIFYELMPASALLGSLFILGAMAGNQELTAMRAAGLSVLGIIKCVLLAGAILVGVSILVGEFIAPRAEQAARVIKATAKSKQVIMNAKYGVWLREGTKFINVRQVPENGKFEDISVYDVEDGLHLSKTWHAEKGVYLKDQQWQLQNIKQSEISTEQMQASTEGQRTWTSSIAPDLLKIVAIKPENLSLYDLALYINFLKENHQKSHTFEMAFWGRIVNPLVTFIMLLMSAPFVIGVKRGISTGGRMLVGVIIGLGFNIFDRIAGHLGLIYDLNPPLMAFLPSFIFLAGTLYALKKTQ